MIEPVRQAETAEIGGQDGPPPHTSRSRLRPVSAMVLVTAVFFALTLALSFRATWDADTANVTLQGWDMIHGQVLLHGWWSTDVNFYTFDLPIYALTVLVFGLGDAAPHVAGSVVYTLIFVAACWLAKGRSTGSALWLRVALVALFMSAAMFNGNAVGTYITVPDHDGTFCFFLVAYVLYSRFADRRWTPWVMLALLTLGQISDLTTRYILVPSLLVVWAVEHLRARRLRTPESWLALAAVGSVVLSFALRTAMIHLGAYYLAKANTKLAPASQAGWHFTGTWESLMSLYGVDFADFPGGTAAQVAVTLIGGIAMVCGLLSTVWVLIRWTKVETADRLLAVTVIVYLGAYEFSTVGQPGGGNGYEFVGVVTAFAVLSARTASSLPPLRLPSYRVASTALAGIGAFAFMLSGTSLFQSDLHPSLQPLSSWLEEHNMTYGLAGYFNASPITVFTKGKVSVRPIVPEPGSFIPRAWDARRQWFEPSKYDARFVIAEQDPNATLTVSQAEGAFGKPTTVYQVGQYQVLVYSYNLLTRGTPAKVGPGD